MANTISSTGSGTLGPTGPGNYASVVITDASVNTTDNVFINPNVRVEDYSGVFGAYASDVSSGSFTVKSNRKQLPENMTFDYVAITTA